MGDVRRAWTAYAVSQAGSGIGTGALSLVAILILGVSDWQVSVLAAVAPGSAAGLALIIGAVTMLLLCAGVFNPAFATYRMQAVEDGYLVRVTAAWAVSSKIAQPIVIAAAGLAAAVLGARTALVVLAGVLLAGVVLLPRKAWPPGSEPSVVPGLQSDAAKR